MTEMIIRHVLLKDLDECLAVETTGFPPEETATRETMRLRIATFPHGFLVAELDGKVVGMLNSAATDKDDISDEELKELIGHASAGKNRLVFALAVLPPFQKWGIAHELKSRFVEEARARKKENVLLMCKDHLIGYMQGWASLTWAYRPRGTAAPNGMRCAWR